MMLSVLIFELVIRVIFHIINELLLILLNTLKCV